MIFISTQFVREESQHLLPRSPTHATSIERASISSVFSSPIRPGPLFLVERFAAAGEEEQKARERTGSERVKAGCCSRDTMPRLFVSPEMTPTRVSLSFSQRWMHPPHPAPGFSFASFLGLRSVRAPAFTN
ncbi:hypothetical protein CEXT_483041 [Caerostris extrusa]|uniref:Uncharacterized protein n=1 Tax=Caerostris extrusa TaxID=172846 RepID=A0AAV4U7U7_CAEEX|nr:hypothetical protein CEXT_483041 [Caerostris extrusa]